MLHLFDKVYLEHDGFINIQFDRAVISPYTGHELLPGLDKMGFGKLLYYSTDKSVVDFTRLFSDIKTHCDETGNRFIIYCDWATYAFIAAGWYKKFTNFTKEEFELVMKTHHYKEKYIKFATARGDAKDDLISSLDVWDNMQPFNINLPNITFSIDLYIATYFYDSNTSHKDKLKFLVGMFLRRQWQELFVDFRTWLQTHILNERIQTFLGADGPKTIEQVSEIPQYSLLLDQDIWNDDKLNVVGKNSSLDLMDTNLEKLTQLHTLYKNFEQEFLRLGGQIYQNFFDRLFYIAGKDLTDEELGMLMSDYAADPWDCCFLPGTDVQNYNILTCIHVANLKRKNQLDNLQKFTLK